MMSGYFRNVALAAMLVFTLSTMDTEAKKDKPKENDAALFLAPLNDSLNIDAGTMEAVFSLNYSFDDYLRPDTSACTPFIFLKIYNKDVSSAREKEQGMLTISESQSKGSHGIYFGTNYYSFEIPGPPIYRSGGTGINPDKNRGSWLLENEWHSLAVTWKVENDGLHAEMFLDGKPQTSKIFPLKESGIRPFSKDDLIGIGSLDMSAASILTYRLSKKVRTKEEIASNDPLKPDESTTFFLDAEIAAKCAKYDAKDFNKINNSGEISAKKNGVFFGNYKIIKTPKGKAIQFYDKLSR